MSKFRPLHSIHCVCGYQVKAGYWRTGTYTVQPDGRKKLTEKGYWAATCPKCKSNVRGFE